LVGRGRLVDRRVGVAGVGDSKQKKAGINPAFLVWRKFVYS
jgi:hypothetical protein